MVACQAHNLKVVGSIPTPATIENSGIYKSQIPFFMFKFDDLRIFELLPFSTLPFIFVNGFYQSFLEKQVPICVRNLHLKVTILPQS